VFVQRVKALEKSHTRETQGGVERKSVGDPKKARGDSKVERKISEKPGETSVIIRSEYLLQVLAANRGGIGSSSMKRVTCEENYTETPARRRVYVLKSRPL